jgi:adenylate cyclase
MSIVVGGVFLAAVLALERGMQLQPAWAMVAGPVGFLAGYGIRIRLLDRASYRMRREFGRYLSPVLVQHMVDTGQLPRLGGEEREVTVLFADLSGFTAASERLESAELMRVLNRYLDAIAGVIADRGGYVDKFIGDAVMAMFNAPAPMDDHAAQAVAAAHEIEQRVRRMANDDRTGGRYAFRVKVGIATGPATVGNVGARDRVNYTVVGETVNIAARLEALPGLFDTPIVIGPRAAEAVAGRYRMLRIATVHVKGITEGVPVFAPIDRPKEPEIEERLARYHRALDDFENGRFAAAAAWSDLAAETWPGAPIAARMRREAERHATTPPKNWKGILEANVK